MAGQKNRLTPLGKEIKKKLADKEMRQVELAEQIGTSNIYLSRIIHGARSGRKYLDSICSVLGIDPNRYRESA